MSTPLLLLLLLAAAVHAGWNLLLQRPADRHALVWWASAVSTICLLPFMPWRPPLDARGWLLALASAGAEAAYYSTLVSAYAVEDFSVVYPIARGGAPALLLLWSMLFLGEKPGWTGAAGIGLIVTGLMVVGSARLRWHDKRIRVTSRGIGLALLVSLLISIYSVIDGGAVKRADPIAYTGAVYGLTTLFLVLPGRKGRTGPWRAAGALWPRALAVGVLQATGYLAVLFVYSRAAVSYAGAVRESSVVLGALAGWLWLGEEFGPRRVMGACLMVAGVALIAMAR